MNTIISLRAIGEFANGEEFTENFDNPELSSEDLTDKDLIEYVEYYYQQWNENSDEELKRRLISITKITTSIEEQHLKTI